MKFRFKVRVAGLVCLAGFLLLAPSLAALEYLLASLSEVYYFMYFFGQQVLFQVERLYFV